MRRFANAVVLLCALTVPGLAQDPGEDPEHGVARISLLNGEVTVRRGDTGESIAAELNAPLVALDHVLTDRNSRAEIQFDWANILRLGPDSEVRLAELRDRDFLIQVAVGTVTFRVLRDSDADVEISTPTASIRPREKGTYRIVVRDDYSTEVTVRSGEADVFVAGRSDVLRSGLTLRIGSDPANPQQAYLAAIPRDDWDSWNESRDRDLERSDSYKYVSRDIYGADDLAAHGRWVYDPPYGWVWAPNVAAAWAPYREGRWSWVNYYGWTWVSHDPWGWAPYHYGRWYHGPRYGWVWYPGEPVRRHYWQPALVAFFGWGSGGGGISVGFGFGNVGWVPLAPYEVYRPWYGRGRVAVNNVTIVNNINVINTYHNARFVGGRNGVTSVVAGDFGRRRVNVNNVVYATDHDLARVGDVRGGRMFAEPSRESRQFSDRTVTVRNNPRPDVDRSFVRRSDRDGRDRPAASVDVRPDPRRDAQVRPSQPAAAPRGNQERARPAQLPENRVTSSDGNAAIARRADTARRNDTPAVAAPRVEQQERQRPAQPPENRATPSDSNAVIARRTDPARRNDTPAVAFPRVEQQERARPAQVPENRATPTDGNAVIARRADAVRRNDTSAVAPPRIEQARQRPEAIVRSQSSESGRPAGNVQSVPAPSPREAPRAQRSAPQSNAGQAPAAANQRSSESQRGGRGRR